MIKVLVPSMPSAEDLMPYLRRMDEARVWVNHGPMLRQLQTELFDRVVRMPCTAVANGTVSLELALRALQLPSGSSVLVPAVTYVASGQAIVNAGLRPIIGDVRPLDWQLSPHVARAAICEHPEISAVLPVAAFGAPVWTDPWEQVARDTGRPVLIDAAGAIFDQGSSAHPRILISYSLHATKALGAGEGGLVASANALLIERVASLANFGPGGTNAKMSEYHAAAALASLRLAPQPWRAHVDAWYAAGRLRGLGYQRSVQHHRTLLPVLLPHGVRAEAVQEGLLAAGVEAKLWYRPFLDERPEFADCIRLGPLPVTRHLRHRVIGLPYHAFLTQDDVRLVCAALRGIIG